MSLKSSVVGRSLYVASLAGAVLGGVAVGVVVDVLTMSQRRLCRGLDRRSFSSMVRSAHSNSAWMSSSLSAGTPDQKYEKHFAASRRRRS